MMSRLYSFTSFLLCLFRLRHILVCLPSHMCMGMQRRVIFDGGLTACCLMHAYVQFLCNDLSRYRFIHLLSMCFDDNSDGRL